MFDVTMILQGLIVLLVGILVYKLFPVIKSAVPAAVLHVLKLVARFAVYAVEAEFESGEGEKKFDAALEMVQGWMKKFGLTFDLDTIKKAIHEEWYKLNFDQIEAGVKTVPVVEQYDVPMDKWPAWQIYSFLTENDFDLSGLPAEMPSDPEAMKKVLLDYCEKLFEE